MDNFIDKFVASYGAAPTAVAEAPGRLEILGNHTDYNQGYVLSCAVAQNTKFALRPIAGTVCRIRDFRDGSEMKIDLADWNTPPPRDG